MREGGAHNNNNNNMYRIGKQMEKTVPAQAVAPLTCRLLSAFDRADVPVRFQGLRARLGDVGVTLVEYIKEVVSLLRRMPTRMNVDSALLRLVQDQVGCDTAEACKLYLLAYLVPKREAYGTYAGSETHLATFMSVGNGVNVDKDAALARVDLVLRELLRMELEDRCEVVLRLIDSPFYVERGSETALAALAHYHAPFVHKFKETARPFVRDLDRAHELVRLDFDLFATTLRRLPARGSVITQRLERVLFPEGEEDSEHEESSRVAWAFCSIWFVECVNTFKWTLSPKTLRRIWSCAARGETLTLLEVTRPFGSKGTWVSSS